MLNFGVLSMLSAIIVTPKNLDGYTIVACPLLWPLVPVDRTIINLYANWQRTSFALLPTSARATNNT